MKVLNAAPQWYPGRPAPAKEGESPRSVTDELLDRVVEELNELHRGAALDTALRMGQVIVNRFYGGDLTAWRRHTTKEASFRKLAARANSDLRISPTGLYRAVALYELVERLHLKQLQHVGVTHLRLVLGLPEDQQRRLVAAAEENGWQSDKLELEAARVRGTLPRRTGRIGLPPLLKVARSIGQLSHRARALASDGDHVAPLSAEELRGVHQALEMAKQDLEKLQRTLLSAALHPRQRVTT